MKKLILIYFFLSFCYLSLILSVLAHQPVLNDESDATIDNPYIIEQPEISKAIFSELKGKPYYFNSIEFL